MVAWAGGVVDERQAAAALAVAGGEPLAGDADLSRSGSLVRLADPGSSRFTGPVIALPGPVRRAMAAAVLEQAASVCADPVSGLVDRVVAGGQRTRCAATWARTSACPWFACSVSWSWTWRQPTISPMQPRSPPRPWPGAPVATRMSSTGRSWRLATLRLTSAQPTGDQDPLTAELIVEATAGGAAIGLEARVWAAVNVLVMPGRTERALRLIAEVTAELDSRGDLGESGVSWRLLLAICAGRVGYTSAALPLLAPLLSSRDAAVQDAAIRGRVEPV